MAWLTEKIFEFSYQNIFEKWFAIMAFKSCNSHCTLLFLLW